MKIAILGAASARAPLVLTAIVFQSVTTSALAIRGTPRRAAAVLAIRSARFRSLPDSPPPPP